MFDAPGDDVVDALRPHTPNQEVSESAQAHVLMPRPCCAQPRGSVEGLCMAVLPLQQSNPTDNDMIAVVSNEGSRGSLTVASWD